jgi:hypothetical protein
MFDLNNTKALLTLYADGMLLEADATTNRALSVIAAEMREEAEKASNRFELACCAALAAHRLMQRGCTDDALYIAKILKQAYNVE